MPVPRAAGYKPNVISTLVDRPTRQQETGMGYKPNVISTIVDDEVSAVDGDGAISQM